MRISIDKLARVAQKVHLPTGRSGKICSLDRTKPIFKRSAAKTLRIAVSSL